MHLVFTVLAVICILGGFAGLFLGVVPTIVLWILAALFILAGWKSRPARQRRHEDQLGTPPG